MNEKRKNIWFDPADAEAIAVRLRRETTLTIKAITTRVHLGTYDTANARLHRAMKEGPASSDNAQATTAK